MKEMITKYGLIKGISSFEVYRSSALKECMLQERNILYTSCGCLVPQYEENHVRRKYTPALTFYENGNLKSISLNSQTTVKTVLGTISAEKITFYEDESFKRIFPVNGKLTGYWNEDNEYALVAAFEINLSVGSLFNKVICLHFYPSQAFKSLTLWPKERAEIQTPVGRLAIRIGIALYETGELKSCEPAEVTVVNTPIGAIMAFDSAVVGIHGDNNSLQFYPDGTVKALATSTDKIEIFDEAGNKVTYFAREKLNHLMPDAIDIIPVRIAFEQNKVIFNDELVYNLDRHSFKITHFFKKAKDKCSDCSNCSLCH